MSTVNIAGLDKAALLAALYNEASPLGMGMLHYNPNRMSTEEARVLMGIETNDVGFDRGTNLLYFDYVKGRPLKVDLSKDEMRTDLYNRDQGEGAAERVVAQLRNS